MKTTSTDIVQSSTTRTAAVLVVGAGPVGLTTAAELARRDVPVRIIEKRARPSTRSKALVVHARTLELLDGLGAADELVRRGYTSPGIDFSSDADKPLRASMYRLQTRYPFILILPQAETEAVIENRLNGLGVRVERGRELVGFDQDADGVLATIRDADGGGAEERIEVGYLVGADGSRSVVRERLGIPFEGRSYEWTAFLGDCRVEGHHAEGGTEQHSNGRGLAFIVPFEDGSHRFVTIDRKYQGGPRRTDLSLNELRESASAILGKPLTLRDPVWLTRWGASLKIADRYRDRRVFLAGDAAHTHSPAGGQGMNTGVQDAFNLGWKLAGVAAGIMPPSLLDTYEAERRPVGERVLKTSDRLIRSLLLTNPVLRGLRELAVRALLPVPAVQKALASNLSGIGVRYDTGVGPLAGARLPDAELRTPDGGSIRLHRALDDRRLTLLLFGDPKRLEAEGDGLRAILALDDRSLAVRVILNNGLPALHEFEPDTLVDHRGEFETRIGNTLGRLLVVRPDGHVAVDTTDWNAGRLAAAIAPWLGAAAPGSRAVAA